MKPRYYIKEDFPFSKYTIGTYVFPNKKEIVEFKKYPRTFLDKTILFEIIEVNQDNEPIVVKCLKNDRIFRIGEQVVYRLSHLKYHVSFKITGFIVSSDLGNNIIYGCYNPILSRACGLSLCNHLVNENDFEKIVYLEDIKD